MVVGSQGRVTELSTELWFMSTRFQLHASALRFADTHALTYSSSHIPAEQPRLGRAGTLLRHDANICNSFIYTMRLKDNQLGIFHLREIHRAAILRPTTRVEPRSKHCVLLNPAIAAKLVLTHYTRYLHRAHRTVQAPALS